MLRSISKQSGESVESVLKKNRKATQGRINFAEKEGFKFKPGTKEWGGWNTNNHKYEWWLVSLFRDDWEV